MNCPLCNKVLIASLMQQQYYCDEVARISSHDRDWRTWHYILYLNFQSQIKRERFIISQFQIESTAADDFFKISAWDEEKGCFKYLVSTPKFEICQSNILKQLKTIQLFS